MDAPLRPNPQPVRRTNLLLAALAVSFGALAFAFVAELWGRPPALTRVAAVDKKFLETAPMRKSYGDLVAAKEDLSDYDCYACHEKNKPPPIKFDANHRIIIPKEHANIVMGHGSHDRNNLCYNCHLEQNLLLLQVRDGRELKFDQSVPLCGSCHGPTYRDWEGGAHGRTSGFWNAALGGPKRLVCVNCHDPHAPRIEGRAPAPPPHALRMTEAREAAGAPAKPPH
jgi:hypothetical protein